MSEIQCSNISSSKKKRSTKPAKKSLEAFKKIINESSEIENCPNSNDKVAILNLVKRNLQKICLTKTSPTIQQTSFLHVDVGLHNNRLSGEGLVEAFKQNTFENTSRNTKELLRKAILEKRKCFGVKQEDFHIDFKQKIWRPW